MNKVPISQVAIPVLGGTPKRSVPSYWNGRVKWATAKDVANSNGRFLISTAETISEEGLNNSAAKILPKGTVIITARGTVGAIAQLGEDMAFNQTCYGLVAKEGMDQDYLYYALKASIQEMKAVSYGTVFDTITMKSFDEIYVPHPPLPEQKAIAHILGTLDDKIELNRRMNETLEEIAKAIFKSWFVDFDPVIDNALKAGNPIPDALAKKAARRRAILEKLEKEDPNLPKLSPEIARLFPDSFEDSPLGPIPRGWRVGALSEISVLETNTVFPSQKPDSIWEYYSIPAFDEGKTPKSELGKNIKSGKYKVPKEAVLVSKLNPQFPRIWRPAIANESLAVCSTEFMPFVPKEVSWRSFLYEFFKSDFVQEQIISQATGSTGSRQRVQPKNIAKMFVLVPETTVIEKFCENIEALHLRISKNLSENRSLDTLRDALLPKLISGQIRIKDAEKFVEEVL